MNAAFERAVTALRLQSANTRHPVTPLTPDDLPPLSDMAPGIGKMYRAQVRAVLAAIREPTPAVSDAFFEIEATGHSQRTLCEAAWRAGIDEVLRDV